MALLWERLYPLLIAIAAAAVWWACGQPFPKTEDGATRDLFATAMSLASITVGFLATAMSIVIAAPDGALMRQLRTSSYLDDLVRYLREPFQVGLLVAGLSLLGFFTTSAPLDSLRWLNLLFVFCATLLLSTLFRIGSIFVTFMRAIAAERLSPPRAPSACTAKVPVDSLDGFGDPT